MSYENTIKKSNEAYNGIMWYLYTHGRSAPLSDLMSLEGFETPYLSRAMQTLITSHRVEFGNSKSGGRHVFMVKEED